MAFQYLNDGCKKEGDRLFNRVCCDIRRRNGFKLKEGIFDTRKKFFTTRVVKQWLRGVVETPCLEIFKVRPNRVLST